MPMSWLTPAFCVHRSALALSSADPAAAGVKVIERALASMSFHVLPSLPVSRYWDPLLTLCRLRLVVGTSSAVRRVGEKGMPAPAAVKIVAPVTWFAFHTSL